MPSTQFIIWLLFSFVLVNSQKMLTVMNKTFGIKYPIILIPGLGGSQAYCEPKTNKQAFTAFSLWFNWFYLLLPERLATYFNLKYDPVTYEGHDADECKIDFPGWGETWSVEYLSQSNYITYFHTIVSELTEDNYYVRNFTIRGAPYDFRKAPGENMLFVHKMKDLVEETYKNGMDRPVVLFGHSMGSLYTLNFLKHQTKEWKQKYIKAFVSVAAPLGGAVETLVFITHGSNFGVFFRSTYPYRDVFRTMSSPTTVLPNAKLWSKEEYLIITPSHKYSAHDYRAYFSDADYPTGYNVLQRSESSFDPLEDPQDVSELYCVYSTGLLTVDQLIYKPPGLFRSAFPNQTPLLRYGDGDGTVNLRSLQVCNKWPNVKSFELTGSLHLSILNDKRLIDLLKEEITR
uniref:Uncharacterized protein n=1 Tax=Trichobilharzia regenti TaxID=157069 RepID=A0AA85JY35_TRIRE|nr:unnamed protein product [Trichobilharzia regenti]